MSRRKPCGKVTYKRRNTLLRVIARLPVSGQHQEARAYFCRPCNGWHLTSRV